ncbi:cysteine desulfurase family protein [Salimicrobium halophilum]|uniref:Cysteine desulfurase n=1 Tax=Salimicrobium halophilum TaxID=86666 RepID=A0A1G8VJ54_9BACI|nr:cysteine desulfurase family protein [Salimicrobium halophilum]SDJ65989.1 cysteine desulfurase [Salimicrobium halophilum]
MIYLDNSATTHPFSGVLDTFRQTSERYFANPSSIHPLGGEAERLLEASRERVSSILGGQEGRVIFTSGGTESNNLAIKGTAFMHMSRGKHLITTRVEHPSVLETFESLESFGFEITYVDVDEYGHVAPADVHASIREDTILVSIMSVNNEIGSIQPLKEIGDILRSYPKIYFHVDHVQGQGKIDLSLQEAGVDLCSVSGHKIHGLKGTGVLYKKDNVRLFPLNHGGGQEQGIRAGTENLPGIVAFTKALRMIDEEKLRKKSELMELHDHLYDSLEELNGVVVNSPKHGAFHIINFSMPGYKPEAIIHALAKREVYISTKSACSSKEPDRSAVLEACRAKEEIATSALRISLSYETTKEELDTFLEILKEVRDSLVQISEV